MGKVLPSSDTILENLTINMMFTSMFHEKIMNMLIDNNTFKKSFYMFKSFITNIFIS